MSDTPGYRDSVEHRHICGLVTSGAATARAATASAHAKGVHTLAVELDYTRAELRYRNRCYGRASDTIGALRNALAAAQSRRTEPDAPTWDAFFTATRALSTWHARRREALTLLTDPHLAHIAGIPGTVLRQVVALLSAPLPADGEPDDALRGAGA